MKLCSLLNPHRIPGGLAARTEDESLVAPLRPMAAKPSRDRARGASGRRGRRLVGGGSTGTFPQKIAGSR
ncbi:MAG TPA: hypothetical protein VG457_06580 [Planctomycetota bacterium]|nr:hypothetical protein [Planctomycetota bacterium]